MLDQDRDGVVRLSSIDRRGDEPRRAVRLPGTAPILSVRTFDVAVQYGSSSWSSPDVPLARPAPRRTKTGDLPPLTTLGRIVAAIRLWRGRSLGRQQLRALDDRLLKDIGLKREEVGYEFPKPFRHCD
jgi:uncharacterized protein YjiS (DUF1127 family)